MIKSADERFVPSHRFNQPCRVKWSKERVLPGGALVEPIHVFLLEVNRAGSGEQLVGSP